MEKKNPSILVNALTWGVIIGLVMIVYSLILYMLNLMFNQALGYAGVILIIAGLAIAMKNYRDKVLDGIMPFGKAFGFGILIIIVAALLGAIFTYLLYAVIDTGLGEKLMEFTTERMLKRGVPEAQLDIVLERAERFQKPLPMAITGLITSILGGVVISLIMAAIFKKEEA
jgi:membrane-bound ClpP family serine protease